MGGSSGAAAMGGSSGAAATGRWLATLVVCALAVGCGSSTPPTSHTITHPASAPAANLTAQRTHEYPASPAAATTRKSMAVAGGWRNPVQAVQVFAQTYINWTATNISARLGALAEVSVGQARSAVSLAAARAAHDYELHRGGIANQGTVEAISPLARVNHAYVVVTKERTSATNDGAYAGLQASWHVAIATVTQISGGLWVLSGWQPER